MKRIAIGLAVLALSALAAVAAADAQKMSTTHGLVSSVDASAGSLVVKADDGHGKKDQSGPVGPSLTPEDLKELEDLDLSEIEKEAGKKA